MRNNMHQTQHSTYFPEQKSGGDGAMVSASLTGLITPTSKTVTKEISTFSNLLPPKQLIMFPTWCTLKAKK